MPSFHNHSRVFYVLLGAGLAMVLLIGSFSLGRRSIPSSTNSNPVFFSSSPAFAATSSTNELKAGSLADIAERTLASVVNISSTRKVHAERSPFYADPIFREFFRHFGPTDPSPKRDHSLGSGVIVSADGLVLTNNHVIDDSDKIRVTLSNKREFDAKVIGADPKSDLAVIKLLQAKDLHPIPIGDSDRIRLGDLVLAIGNPFGVGQTVTMGIVSAKGRANMGIVDYEDFIQTDAAINPGNSGGALINLRGEVVGINTAILSRTGGNQGIGFAIPTNMARPIMESLLKTGKVSRGWMGVAIQPVDDDLAKALKLPTTSGVLISDVTMSSPAARGGLKRGDLVVKLNGQDVDSPAKLRNLVAAAGAKSKAKISYYRNGKLLTTEVTLSELPTDLARAGLNPGVSEDLTVGPLDSSSRNRFNIPDRLNFGVIIQSVKPQSPAAQAGLQPGDVILEVNRATIESVSRFHQIYSTSKGKVLLLVYRRGSTFYSILNR